VSTTSNIPKCAWIIVAIPTALLVLSFSWLVLVYSCVLKSAKESTVSTPWFTITSKVDTLDNNVQEMLGKYNQLLVINNQLVEQLSRLKKEIPSSSAPSASKPNNLSVAVPSLLDSAKQQSNLLIEQKQKLQGISTEIRNVKAQFQGLEKSKK
jgi:uncharacterized protein YoxC